MSKFFLTFIIQPMKFILFFFKTKLFTVAGLWSMLLGAVTMVLFSIYNFIVPIWPFILAVVLLTSLDMWTGIQAAKVRIKKYEKEHPGEKSPEQLTSKGYFRTSQKAGVYVAGILGAHAIWLVFFKDIVPIDMPVSSPLVYLVSFPMVRTELKSLDENVFTVTGTSFWYNVKKYFPGNKNNIK